MGGDTRRQNQRARRNTMDTLAGNIRSSADAIARLPAPTRQRPLLNHQTESTDTHEPQWRKFFVRTSETRHTWTTSCLEIGLCGDVGRGHEKVSVASPLPVQQQSVGRLVAGLSAAIQIVFARSTNWSDLSQNSRSDAGAPLHWSLRQSRVVSIIFCDCCRLSMCASSALA